MKTNKENSSEINITLDLLRQVMVPLWNIIRTRIKKLITDEYGITSSQFHTIRRIKQGSSSASLLANCMQVSRPNISRTVDELVKKGLVGRHRNPQDRRNIQLSLTEKGEELFKKFHRKYDEILNEQFSILTEEELRTLASAFKILKKVINYKIKED